MESEVVVSGLFLPLLLSFRPYLSLLSQVIVSLLGFALSFSMLIEGYTHLEVFKSLFFTFSYKIDPLSMFFVGLILFSSSINAIYSISYIKSFKNQGLLTFLYNSFILSMVFVVLSYNIPTFLIFWEIMSLISFLLVIFEYKLEENLKAGINYIFMTHLGSAFIISAFAMLYLYSSSISFEAFRNISLPNNIKFIIFLLALIGFGTKAGVFGLHTWLPKAHPVAPSNVSALMSGVMIKIAIYMLIRFYFEFLTNYPIYFGYIVVVIGAISSIYGILYAYVQSDIKKALAYSSMENIGIILMGLGMSMIFKSNALYILMGVAFVATLYHILNHAVFKELLFMGTGHILHTTHTKNIEHLGGLIKKMPKTSIFMLIGIMGITALPPFNGFVSEWLMYQAILFGSRLSYGFISFSMPIFASILAITGAFALGTFVKIYGLAFLGLPRSSHVQRSEEAPIFILISIGILAFFVIALGVFPAMVVYISDKVFGFLTGLSIYHNILYKYGFVLVSSDYHFGRISPVVIGLIGIIIFVSIYIFTRVFGNPKLRMYETWACGQTDEKLFKKAQYSAAGFSQPIRRIFSFVYRQEESVEKIESKLKYFFPKKRYSLVITDSVEYIYNKVWGNVLNMILKTRYYIQPGAIHIYIFYIIATLICLLMISMRLI